MRPWIPVSNEPTIEIQSRMVTVGHDKFTAGYAVRYRRRVPAGRILCGPCGKACVPRKDEKPHGHKCDPSHRERNLYRELRELYGTPGEALAAALDSAAHIRPPSQQIEMRATAEPPWGLGAMIQPQ